MSNIEIKIQKLWKPKWVITKVDDLTGQTIEKLVICDNVILYQGLQAVWKLLANVGPAFSPIYNEANAEIIAGTSSASSGDQAQTGLLGTTFSKAVEATYPQTSGGNNENLVYRTIFITGEAEFAWNEIGLTNGVTVFNRLVQSLGSKIANQTWTVDLILEG